jgi:hypothetical protein
MLQAIDYVLKFAALVALLVAGFGVSILYYGKTASKHQVSELAKSMINASLFLAIAIVLVKLW